MALVGEERPALLLDGGPHRTQDGELAAGDLRDEPLRSRLIEGRAGRRTAAADVQPREVVAVHPPPHALEQPVGVEQPASEGVPVGVLDQPLSRRDEVVGRGEEFGARHHGRETVVHGPPSIGSALSEAFVPFPTRAAGRTLDGMEGRSSPATPYVVLALLGAGPLLAVLVAVAALPPADLDATGVGWLPTAMAVVLVGAATAAALARLVVGLRHGSVAALLVAASSAAVAGGGVAVLAGARHDVPLLAASVALLGAAGAERAHLTIRRHGRRVAVAIGAVALAEAAVLLELLPVTATAVDTLRPMPLALGVGAAAAGTLLGIGLPVGAVGASLVVGVTAPLAGREALETVVGTGGLIAAQLIALTTARARESDAPADLADGALLPALATRVDDAILSFDGQLRLRDWNAAAVTLLGLDAATRNARLEEVLGLSLSDIPRTDGESVSRTGTAGLTATLHRHEAGLTAVVRDRGGSAESERLSRELRGTIEELLEARRTIDLQRRELERAATVDPLTGLSSRWATMERLTTEVAQARRYEHAVAVALLDVDDFGSVNQAHGVAGGDAALRELALRVRLRVRAADELGRVGSDGFLAILPHTDESGAATFADAVRQRIAGRPITVGDATLQLTVSIGIAVMRPGEDLDVDALLSRAQEALASAKAAGGDRVALDRLHGLVRLEERREPRLHAVDADHRDADDR